MRLNVEQNEYSQTSLGDLTVALDDFVSTKDHRASDLPGNNDVTYHVPRGTLALGR